MADPTAIFLDTQVFEAASFNFKTTVLVSVVEEAKKGTIRLVLTDIIVQEVRARIEKNVTDEFGLLRKFRTKARVVRSSDLAEAKTALELGEKDVIADLHYQFEEFLKDSNAEIIDASELPAGPVFKKYFAGDPRSGAATRSPSSRTRSWSRLWKSGQRKTGRRCTSSPGTNRCARPAAVANGSTPKRGSRIS